MSVSYSYEIYVVTKAENLTKEIKTEILRESRYDIKTGERLADYVETESHFEAINSVINMGSGDLKVLELSAGDVNVFDLVELNDYGDIDSGCSHIILCAYSANEMYGDSVTEFSVGDWQMVFSEKVGEFRKLTGYEGEVKVYVINFVG
jgi:hypothetical protein